MEAMMEIRSTRTTLTFRKEFTLPYQDRQVPPGDYVLVVEEERLQGLTFDAYRRVSGFLIVEGGSAHPGRTEMIPVTEAEVAQLVAGDQDPVAAPAASGPTVTR
jgi:hypothetical protein